MTRSSLWSSFRWIARYADRSAERLAWLAALLVVSVIIPMFDSYGLKVTVDAMAALDRQGMVKGIVMVVGAFLAESLIAGANTKLRVSLMESAALNQRRRLVDTTMSIPMLAFDRIPRGDVISRITSDAGEASRIFTSVWYLCDISLKAVSASVFMLFLNWRVGVLVLAGNVIVVALTRRLNVSMPEKAKAHRDSLGRTSARALNILEGRRVIKAFLAKDQMERWFRSQTSETYAAEMDVARLVSWNEFCTYIFAFVPMAAAFGYGGYLAAIGLESLGGILAVLRLTDYIGPLAGLNRWLAEAQGSVGAYQRVEEFWQRAQGAAQTGPAVSGVAGAVANTAATAAGTAVEDTADHAVESTAEGVAPVPHAPAISVADLSFEYEPGRPVLDGISLEVPAGKMVALAGKSGSGKSTLLKILAGLYPASSGTVRVCGHLLSDDTTPEMRRIRSLVTYSPQEAFLFAGTVRENLEIARGEPAAELSLTETWSSESTSTDEITHALRLAAAEEFVLDLPEGLDEPVREKGSRFSGGQRQRLSAARSFLRGAPVLLLDEPTSSLDRESEERLLAGLREICSSGVTALVVTHRPRVAESCDLVLLLDEGRIAASGTHGELVESNRLYAGLFANGTSSGSKNAVHHNGRGAQGGLYR